MKEAEGGWQDASDLRASDGEWATVVAGALLAGIGRDPATATVGQCGLEEPQDVLRTTIVDAVEAHDVKLELPDRVSSAPSRH